MFRLFLFVLHPNCLRFFSLLTYILSKFSVEYCNSLMYAAIVHYLNLIYWQVIYFKSLYLEEFLQSIKKDCIYAWTIITIDWNKNLINYFIVWTLLNVHLDVNVSVLHFICYKLTPLENHCAKVKVLLTLHSNSTVVEESTVRYIWEHEKGWITSS